MDSNITDKVKEYLNDKSTKLIIITGPNGQGKTTILNIIHTILKTTNNELIFIGSDKNFNDFQIQVDFHSSTKLSKKSIEASVERIYQAFNDKTNSSDLEQLDKLVYQEINLIDLKGTDKKEQIESRFRHHLSTPKKLNDHFDPIRLLQLSFSGFTQNAFDCELEIRQNWEFQELFNFYKKFYDGEAKVNVNSYHEFIDLVTSDTKLLNECVVKYGIKKSGMSEFFRGLNNSLEEINFKYKFDIIWEEHNRTRIVFVLDKEKKELDKIKLSSGEKWILGILIWKYYIDYRQGGGLRFIIMDEPDRNLDPKLCKQFLKLIQVFIKSGVRVIMTTQRAETVALAGHEVKDSIFMVEKNGEMYDLKKIHTLEAIFRMTSNLREITNFHFKVYTEGLNDAKFYEKVYCLLRDHCSEKRVKARTSRNESGQSDYYWYINKNPFRILSERCQLSFYPVSYDSGGGGCNEVIKAVKRDQNLPKSNKGLFNDKKLQRSYGILDNDFKKDFGLENDKIDDRVVIHETRHSLENFLYDPIILVNVDIENCFANDEIEEKFKTLKEEIFKQSANENDINQKLKDFLKNLLMKINLNKEKIKKEIKKEIDEKKWTFTITNKNLSKEEALNKAQELANDILEKVFEFDINTLKECDDKMKIIYEKVDSIFEEEFKVKKLSFPNNDENKKRQMLKDAIKPVNIINHRIVNEFKEESLEFLGYKEIDVILDEEKIITVNYPNLFLNWRGHNLPNPFTIEIKNGLLDKILESEKLFIPLDLAKVLFSLNQKVLTHVRQVIGKGEIPQPRAFSEWMQWIEIEIEF